MSKSTKLVNHLPFFIILVASIISIAFFSFPWFNVSGHFLVQNGVVLPDLVITNVTWTQLENNNVQITVTIRNNGGTTEKGFSVRFFDVIEDKTVGITTIADIGSGETVKTAIIHNELQPVCPMLISVDWGDMIRESNEANNDAEITMTLG